MRASVGSLLVLASCTGISHEPDASAPDAVITLVDSGSPDAAPDAPPDGGRVPVAECRGLVRGDGATDGSCTPESGYPIECERFLDAPTFVELPGTPTLCDAAVEGDVLLEVPAPIEITDATCDGITLRGATAGFRIGFGGTAGAAALVANLDVDRLVAGARVRDGECTRFLSIRSHPEDRRTTHILDFPPGGGELWLDDAEGEPRWLRVTTVPGTAAPCTSFRSACVEGTVVGVGVIGDGFAIEPCGGTWLPLGGCGDPIFAGFVGSDSCGGRLHALFSPTDYVPICH